MSALKITQQKKVADLVLRALSLIDPYCIVASGAPRDWYFGKEATDIDVFFHVPQHYSCHIVHELLKNIDLEPHTIKLGTSIPDWYKLNPKLMAVYEIEIEGVSVQLMRMSTPTFESVIPNFPLSICHTWYKNGKSHYERPFLIGEKFKAIYKTSEIYNNQHIYIEKVRNKFPDWRYYDSALDMAEDALNQYGENR